MNRLLFNELEERLSRVHSIVTEINAHQLPSSASDLAEEAEELMTEARDILFQGDAYFASPLEGYRS